MTRFVSSSMQALSEQSLLAFRQLVDLGVTSGTVYACTGNQYIYALSTTYSPVGMLGEISPIEEESDPFPRDVTLRLTGVNTLAATGSLSIYEPLRESMFNRPVTIRRVFLDPSSNFACVNTPEVQWRGTVEEVSVSIEDGVYEVRCVTALRRTARAMYFNRETFRAIDSSDTFANHVDQIPLFKSEWGGAPTYFNGGPGVARGPTYGGRFGEYLTRRGVPTGG